MKNDSAPRGQRPRALQISLESDDPLGPTIRRLANSDTIAITFPRDALRRVSARPELTRRGIYMLIALDPEPFELGIYVGQAQNVLRRLRQHERGSNYHRYLQIVVIVSADNQLRGDVAIYVEQRIVKALALTRLVKVENRSARLPELTTEDKAIAEQFFRDAMLLVGPVEPLATLAATTVTSQELNKAFLEQEEELPVAPIQSSVLYELRRPECHAFAVLGQGRSMRVLAGAKIATNIHFSIPHRAHGIRARLQAGGVLVPGPEDEWMILLRDVDVYSHKGAADFVMGRNSSGARLWKLADFTLASDDDV